MLDAKQLATMRKVVTEFMTDSIAIYSVATVKDKFGNDTQILTLLRTVKGQLSSPSGRENAIISALVNQGTEQNRMFKLTLPYGTELDANNVVRVNGDDFNVEWTNAGQTFIALTEAIISRKVIA